MDRDVLTGALGAVFVLAAMAGVFVYERGTAPESAVGDVSSTQNRAGPSLAGSVGLGKTTALLANVTEHSASNITFHLAWKATSGHDQLRLTVAPPARSGIDHGAAPDASDSGDITANVTIPVGADPAGEWEVKVSFESASPDSLPGGISPPASPPGTTDATVSFSVFTAVG
jgi:hypothetical protein